MQGLFRASSRIRLLIAVMLFATGCARSGGSGGPSGEEPPRLGSSDELRRRLEYFVESGVTGSGLGGIPEIIATLPQREALEADYKKLEAAKSAEQVKSIAKGMIEKL